jgi:hypothetical protein
MENSIEQKQKNFRFLAYLCLIVGLMISISSGVYTISLAKQLAGGGMTIFSVIIGFTFDFCKYAFSVNATYQYQKGNVVASLVYTFLAIAFTLVSFFASQTYDLNHNNKILNKTTKSSDLYNMKKDNYDDLNKQIEQDQNIVNDLRNNKDKKVEEHIKPLIENRDKYNENTYRTLRGQLQEKINSEKEKKSQEIDNQIAALDKKIEKNQLKLESTEKGIEKTNGNIRTEEGLYSLAKMFNSENPDTVMYWIGIIKNSLIEIAGIALFACYGLLLGKSKSKGIFGSILSFKDKFTGFKSELRKPTTATSQNDININTDDNLSSSMQNHIDINDSDIKKKDNLVSKNFNINTNKKHKIDLGKTNINTNVNIEEVKPKRKIGFEMPSDDDITDKDLEMYLEAFYNESNWHNGYPAGYAKIARIININTTLAQKIRGQLERMKIIGTEKHGRLTRSKSLMDYNKAIRTIQKLY